MGVASVTSASGFSILQFLSVSIGALVKVGHVFLHFILSSLCRVPILCSWRWNWTAQSWRADPSGWRGHWRRRSRRVTVMAKQQQGRPARLWRRVLDGRGRLVEELSSPQGRWWETSASWAEAPLLSKERWQIQTKRLKRKHWRKREWSQKSLFIFKLRTEKACGRCDQSRLEEQQVQSPTPTQLTSRQLNENFLCPA